MDTMRPPERMIKTLNIPTEAPSNFTSVVSTLQINSVDTSSLKPVGQDKIAKQAEHIAMDLAAAEEAFDTQYKEMLQEHTYDEVVATLGPNDKYYPCDDVNHQCNLLCRSFEDGCPHKEKKEKDNYEDRKVSSSSGGANDNNKRSSSKSSRRRKSKK